MEYTKYHKLELREVLGTNVVKGGKGNQKKDETFKEQATRNWLDIPSDIMINILQRVNVIDIGRNVQRVCTKWRQIYKDPFMWRVIYLDANFYYDYRPNTSPSLLPLYARASHDICKYVVDRSLGQLVDITIVGFCDDEVLQCVAERSSQLRRLKIGRRMYGLFYRLNVALKKFPLLEELSFHFVQFPEGVIETLGRDCPMLKTLILTNQSVYKTDEVGSAVAENLPGLRHLELTLCNFSDTGMRAILDRCHHLQVLYLQMCYPIDLRGELKKRCSQQIKCVKFTSCC